MSLLRRSTHASFCIIQGVSRPPPPSYCQKSVFEATKADQEGLITRNWPQNKDVTPKTLR